MEATAEEWTRTLMSTYDYCIGAWNYTMLTKFSKNLAETGSVTIRAPHHALRPQKPSSREVRKFSSDSLLSPRYLR